MAKNTIGLCLHLVKEQICCSRMLSAQDYLSYLCAAPIGASDILQEIGMLFKQIEENRAGVEI